MPYTDLLETPLEDPDSRLFASGYILTLIQQNIRWNYHSLPEAKSPQMEKHGVLTRAWKLARNKRKVSADSSYAFW